MDRAGEILSIGQYPEGTEGERTPPIPLTTPSTASFPRAITCASVALLASSSSLRSMRLSMPWTSSVFRSTIPAATFSIVSSRSLTADAFCDSIVAVIVARSCAFSAEDEVVWA